ncbi:phosphate ABC transporter substrate-binding protein [Aerococcus urinaehominis]|uniref:Phosphate ABC transporter substrate-binding protein n=1 Tax=Aerococcus urinaehominis TaxID=128944 RepID=A0A0X8FLA8_9LACT|nr:substrate-binding domain-containing protein [Aerococcus urinaehominis]AMB99423.1 phosphate ABC transporter substrate-binding protein [Aerococcus urinaehominis]SDM29692.1 phosphate ABC transporter substrate-binding protein, PhoT family (TC 3.A.1.7.1) [Aerococcus urinaehominis]
MTLNKLSKLILSLGAVATLAACGGGSAQDGIFVISREEGSGTRDAFTEITGVLDENDVDNTDPNATIQNGTDQVITAVSEDPNAIGYISLGSLNDSVKALQVEGVAPSEEAVADGSYKIARPFNIVYKDNLEGAAKDFHDFIFSAEGQQIALDEGYVPVKSDAAAYAGDGSQSGTINVVGSTSVAPVLEKMAEEYMKLNSGVQVNITANGSSAGVEAAQNGTADIGMASRALSEEEAGKVTGEAIAMDGIAVIVNNDNQVSNLSLDQVRDIFTGTITSWTEVQ